MIINKIKKEIENSLSLMGIESSSNIVIEKSRNIKFGDFSSNIAMMLAKKNNKNPMEFAEELVSKINSDSFKNIEISKPGFINFYIKDEDHIEILRTINLEKEKYPKFESKNKKINLEFVSANPTGYLHLGHARNAVLGDVMNSLLTKAGYEVNTEYLVNDAGNQMSKLASSVLVRYKQENKIEVDLPEDSYHGEEIILVAKELYKKFGKKFIDELIDEDFNISKKEVREEIQEFSGNYLLNQIKTDLKSIGVEINKYSSEKKIHESNAIPNVLEKLKNSTYEKDGALWLETTKYGDDKDRVLIKGDKNFTYFTPDIAYHLQKITSEPKPDKLINIWGADHYSYITRMGIALKCLGYEDIMDVICMQMVRLTKNGEEYKLSKRSGNSITLQDLVKILTKDVARWFMIGTSYNTHLEIDINIALLNTNENPIYYVQYAHARSNNLLEKINIEKINFNNLKIKETDNIRELLNLIHLYEQTIYKSAVEYDPTKLTNYLVNLSKLFHHFYTNEQISKENNIEIQAFKILLTMTINQIIKSALKLLGITALNKM